MKTEWAISSAALAFAMPRRWRRSAQVTNLDRLKVLDGRYDGRRDGSKQPGARAGSA